MMVKAKKRTYAFIDSNNLNLGAQSLGWKLDFKKFRIYLKEKYNVSTAYLFIGYVPTNQDLYSSLQKAGYVLIFKPTLPDKDGEIKGNRENCFHGQFKKEASIQNEKAPPKDETLRSAFSCRFYV